MASERKFWIEGLRGILCVWILLFHYTYRFSSLYEENFLFYFDNGKVAVAFFFILSGYLLQATSYKFYKIGAIKWFGNKWIRLFIPYIISCCFIYLVGKMGMCARFELNFVEFLKCCIMIPYFSPLLDGSHWYVFSLIRFYLFFMIMLKFRINKKNWFLGLLLLICITNGFIKFKYGMNFLGYIVPSIIEIRIIAGVILFNTIMERKKENVALLCLIVLYLSYTVHWFYIPIFFLLFFLLATNKLNFIANFLSSRFLLVFGSFSYVLYLIHQNVGYAIELFLLTKACFLKELIPYLTCIVMCLVAFVLNIAINRMFLFFKREK